MSNGAFALLERSLRLDARAKMAHLMRLCLMVAVSFVLSYIATNQGRVGAPGLHFFTWLAYLDAIFLSLLGIGMFSAAITEEKEEDTLGLMLMAGISPLGLLMGKLGSGLWQALLLVAVQYPFMLLAVTLGGVAERQVVSMTVALLAYVIFLAGLGVFCSTIAPNNRRSSTMMVIVLVAYYVVSSAASLTSFVWSRWLAANGKTPGIPQRLLDSVSESNIFFRVHEILSTGFDQSPISTQVLSNSLAGAVLFLASWLLFGPATQNVASEPSSRGLVPIRRRFFPCNVGRSWPNPFLWKDFYFVSGGIGMMLLRSLFYIGFGLAYYSLQAVRGVNAATQDFSLFLILMSLCVSIDAALVLSRSLQDELRGQTLASLLMLPRSSIAIVYTKFAGAILGWIPGPIILLAFTCTNEIGRRDFWWFLTNGNGVAWLIVMAFVLIPHLSAIVSLYVRWGAVPIGFGVAFGTYLGLMTLADSLRPREPPLVAFTVILVCACCACQIGILLRAQALAER